MLPKITIITPSFNQGLYVEQAICSVLAQNYENVEHIVIDGGSTDQTIEILKKYPHVIWMSEKDRGQADALNKGLTMATGDIVGWINSDDYYDAGIFESISKYFNEPKTMWAIGNLTYRFDLTGEVVPDKSPVVTFDHLVKNPDIVRQQPAFFRREFLIRAGGWDPGYFMVMDFDLWIRLAQKATPRMVDENWSYFRIHAQQKTSHGNILRQSREIVDILTRAGVSKIIIAKIRLRKRWQWLKGLVKAILLDVGLLSSKYQHRSIRIRPGVKH
jgi:glycosyltransferase involved in cell wall biosynthesis